MIKKYLQYTKEHYNYIEENFEIGDIITCIVDDDSDDDLKIGNSYRIEDLRDVRDGQIKLVEIDHYWYSDRFRLATPEEIENYMLKKSEKI